MDAINKTVHTILTDPHLKQFDEQLHGLNKRRSLDSDGNLILVNSSESETKESETEEVDENDEQFQKCPVCNLDCRSPNAQMIKEIKKAKEIMKKTLETNHFLKRDFLTSGDILEYTKQPLYCWEPQKILLVVNMTLSDLNCWTDGCNGSITVLPPLNHRSVEGLKSNGFVIFPTYRCAKCKKEKSSLDIDSLHLMGVPLAITRQCPVIALYKSAVTQELAEHIVNMMTSELGAEQIMKGLRKLRDGEYVYKARIFLEVQNQLAKPSSTSDIRSLFQAHAEEFIPKPFPCREQHCGGYGGSRGPSAQHATKIYIAATAYTANLADQIMIALGSDVVKNDHTYFAADTITVLDGTGKKSHPIEGLHIVLGAMGQILSWIWTAGTKAEELVRQGNELFQRFTKFGLMEVIYNENALINGTENGDGIIDVNSPGDNFAREVIGVERAPAFYSDNCCLKWIKGSWPVSFLANLLDSYHLKQRYCKVANKTQPTHYYQFCQFISKCFGENEQGVLFQPDEIIALLDNVKSKFEQPALNVWNNECTKTHENEKTFIRNNTVLPKDICPTQTDRNKKVTSKIGTNANESLHGRLRRYLPKQQGLTLADRFVKLFFLETNVGLIIRFDESRPVINIASFMVPDVLMIYLLSNKLEVRSPVIKLPLVNVGPEGAKNLFGWEGSIDFFKAALASMQLKSLEPSIDTEGAMECVVHEFQESQVGASQYNNIIKKIDDLFENSTESTLSTSSSSLSEPSSSSTASAVMKTTTSPQPITKNRQKNIARTDISNKGGVGNHKTNKNLALSTRV